MRSPSASMSRLECVIKLTSLHSRIQYSRVLLANPCNHEYYSQIASTVLANYYVTESTVLARAICTFSSSYSRFCLGLYSLIIILVSLSTNECTHERVHRPMVQGWACCHYEVQKLFYRKPLKWVHALHYITRNEKWILKRNDRSLLETSFVRVWISKTVTNIAAIGRSLLIVTFDHDKPEHVGSCVPRRCYCISSYLQKVVTSVSPGGENQIDICTHLQ